MNYVVVSFLTKPFFTQLVFSCLHPTHLLFMVTHKYTVLDCFLLLQWKTKPLVPLYFLPTQTSLFFFRDSFETIFFRIMTFFYFQESSKSTVLRLKYKQTDRDRLKISSLGVLNIICYCFVTPFLFMLSLFCTRRTILKWWYQICQFVTFFSKKMIWFKPIFDKNYHMFC